MAELSFSRMRTVPPEVITESISSDALGEGSRIPSTALHHHRARAAGIGTNGAGRALLSPGTVRNYLSGAMTKLHAANQHDACVIARRTGWI